MPATPNLAIPYPVASDTADVPRDIKALADRLDIVGGGGAVTSLPGSPADGQECYFLADAGNGIVWHLRYRAAASGSYKWEFVGGADLASTVDTASGLNSGTYTGITGGPTITVPLAGDYVVWHGAHCDGGSAAAFAAMSYSIGATAAVDADCIEWQFATGGGRLTGTRRKPKTIAAAATALTAQYRSATVVTFSNRWLTARPVRVG